MFGMSEELIKEIIREQKEKQLRDSIISEELEKTQELLDEVSIFNEMMLEERYNNGW